MTAYWVGVATLTGIYMIAILGISILCGFTGLFSMGHAGFMAIGGYVSALVVMRLGVPIPVGIILGATTAAIVGELISYPTLRLRDDYFIIATLGIGEAIKLIIQNLTDLTGGARGLTNIPPLPNAWRFPIVLACVVAVVIFIELFLDTKYGRNCVAVRENELAATSVGIDAFRYKKLAMTISCGLCGLAGGLLAHYMHYLQPNMFTYVKSDELLITVVLGGRGSITGTILATLVLVPLPEYLRFGQAQEWRMVLYGFLVVLVILFRPAGLMGTKELTWHDVKTAARAAGDFIKKRGSRSPKSSGTSN